MQRQTYSDKDRREFANTFNRPLFPEFWSNFWGFETFAFEGFVAERAREKGIVLDDDDSLEDQTKQVFGDHAAALIRRLNGTAPPGSFDDLWTAAYMRAVEEFPRPPADGFYRPDKNEIPRRVRCWKYIIEGGVPEDQREKFMESFDRAFIAREWIEQLAEEFGLKVYRVRTTNLRERLWEKALNNGGE